MCFLFRLENHNFKIHNKSNQGKKRKDISWTTKKTI